MNVVWFPAVEGMQTWLAATQLTEAAAKIVFHGPAGALSFDVPWMSLSNLPRDGAWSSRISTRWAAIRQPIPRQRVEFWRRWRLVQPQQTLWTVGTRLFPAPPIRGTSK